MFKSDLSGISKGSLIGSGVYIRGADGRGSTGTAVRTFTKANAQIDRSAVLYKSDAILGDTFVAAVEGLYAVQWTDNRASPGGSALAIAKNVPNASRTVESSNVALNPYVVAYSRTFDASATCVGFLYLKAGDYLTCHDNTVLGGDATNPTFSMKLMAVA